MLVVERPGRNDNQECEGSASEGDEDGELDVLQEVTDDERDGLDNAIVSQQS